MSVPRLALRLALVAACLLAVIPPAVAAGPREIMVSAAASLRDVLEEAGRMFETQNPGTKVTFNFGASGALRSQIVNGAPVDLFLSADLRDVQALVEPGIPASGSDRHDVGSGPPAPGRALLRGPPRPFLRNELVFFVPTASTLTATGVAGLRGAAGGKFAIGNPRSVPAGRYAQEALQAAGVAEAIADRLVLCENVRQVLDYVRRGEADGGFVYRTDAGTVPPAEGRILFAVPPEQHSPIVYGAGRLAAAPQPELADRFLAFLSGPEAMAVFAAAGFRQPE